jgi:hypothetical protein
VTEATGALAQGSNRVQQASFGSGLDVENDVVGVRCISTHNDYTAMTVVGVQKQALHLLHVSRGHWSVMQMREQICALAALWRVDLVIVEDTSSGMG